MRISPLKRCVLSSGCGRACPGIRLLLLVPRTQASVPPFQAASRRARAADAGLAVPAGRGIDGHAGSASGRSLFHAAGAEQLAMADLPGIAAATDAINLDVHPDVQVPGQRRGQLDAQQVPQPLAGMARRTVQDNPSAGLDELQQVGFEGAAGVGHRRDEDALIVQARFGRPRPDEVVGGHHAVQRQAVVDGPAYEPVAEVGLRHSIFVLVENLVVLVERIDPDQRRRLIGRRGQGVQHVRRRPRWGTGRAGCRRNRQSSGSSGASANRRGRRRQCGRPTAADRCRAADGRNDRATGC